jgi:HlyD family secretion protein
MFKRWLWIILLVVVVLGGAFFAMRPQPADVDLAVVTLGPLRVTVEEEGKTRIRDRFVVSAPVAGYLRRIEWKEGNAVKADDVAAVLEPPRADVLDPRTRELNEARLRAGEASVRAAQSRLTMSEDQVRAAVAEAQYWQQQLRREEQLARSGDLPQDRLARTRTEAERTEAALRAAEKAVVTARADVERTRADVEAARAALLRSGSLKPHNPAELFTVRWPVSGRVLKVIREHEGVVQAGESLMELGDTRALEVQVEVLSVDAVKMGPGTSVEFTRWGGDRPLQGRVRLVEPAGFTKISALGVEEQRVRVIADITSPEDEWQRLGDGYRVEAICIVWQGESVLQIPSSALFRNGDQWLVFAVENSVARRRPVEIGHRSGLAAEILSGLREGEQVITHPDETVNDGKEVRAK